MTYLGLLQKASGLHFSSQAFFCQVSCAKSIKLRPVQLAPGLQVVYILLERLKDQTQDNSLIIIRRVLELVSVHVRNDKIKALDHFITLNTHIAFDIIMCALVRQFNDMRFWYLSRNMRKVIPKTNRLSYQVGLNASYFV